MYTVLSIYFWFLCHWWATAMSLLTNSFNYKKNITIPSCNADTCKKNTSAINQYCDWTGLTPTTDFCSSGNSGTRWGTEMTQKSQSGKSSNALRRKSHDLQQQHNWIHLYTQCGDQCQVHKNTTNVYRLKSIFLNKSSAHPNYHLRAWKH